MNTWIDSAEHLCRIMLTCNLLQYKSIYSMTSVSFQNNYRDEIDDVDNYASEGKSFNNKTKIIGKTQQDLHHMEVQEAQTN